MEWLDEIYNKRNPRRLKHPAGRANSGRKRATIKSSWLRHPAGRASSLMHNSSISMASDASEEKSPRFKGSGFWSATKIFIIFVFILGFVLGSFIMHQYIEPALDTALENKITSLEDLTKLLNEQNYKSLVDLNACRWLLDRNAIKLDINTCKMLYDMPLGAGIDTNSD